MLYIYMYMTCLQQRCIQALCSNATKNGKIVGTDFKKRLQKLSHFVLEAIVVHSLSYQNPCSKSECKKTYSKSECKKTCSKSEAKQTDTKSEAKKTKKGLYLQPPCRPRKGTQWDAVSGKWSPMKNLVQQGEVWNSQCNTHKIRDEVAEIES